MPLQPSARDLRTRLRAWIAEIQTMAHTSFGLTPREREGALLVAALFVLGLAVQWLRWLLKP